MISLNNPQKRTDFLKTTNEKNNLCSNLDLIHKAYRYSNNPKAFFNNTGLVVSVNPAFEDLVDIKFAQLKNKTWYELLNLKPDDKDFDAIMDVITGTKDNCKFETSLRHRCNGPFKTSIYAYGLKNLADKVEFLTIELTKLPQHKIEKQDVCATHEMICKTAEHRKEKKLAAPILKSFSHEVRTSLNGIVGFTNIIAGSDLSPSTVICHMDMIKSCTSDLLNIAENIIEFMQIETGVAKITPSLVNLNNLLINIYELIQSIEKPRTSQIHLALGLDNNTCNILLDEFRLQKILVSMLNKAIKTVGNESIMMGYESLQNSLLFFIFNVEKETPEISCDLLLNRLSEVSAKTKNNPDQLEFELQIAKSLTEFLGGKFSHDNDPLNGIVFFLELPVISEN